MKRAIVPEEYERLAADSFGVLGRGTFKRKRFFRCPLCGSMMARVHGARRWFCPSRDPAGRAHCVIEVSSFSLAVDP